MKDVIDTIQSLLDDCAATGDSEQCHRIAERLEHLRYAAATRGAAIGYRLKGRIEDALGCERLSDRDFLRARGEDPDL